MPEFDGTRCDLCGEAGAETLLECDRSMTSDSRVSAVPLGKLRCTRCGLVRNAEPFPDEAEHYAHDYRLAADAEASEPVLFLPEGPRTRSGLLAAWIRDALAAAHVPEPRRVVEVGASEGLLLSRLQKTWPGARVEGWDLHARAAERGRRRGVPLHQGGYEDAARAGHTDLLYSVAVIEHVPSPRHFLTTLAGALADDGTLLCVLPCQDEPSMDLWFSDHVHHFHTRHVAALARAAGLREVHRETHRPGLPGFSLHVLRPHARDPGPAWTGPPAPAPDAAHWRAVAARTDGLLAAEPDPVAVWGLGQTCEFLRAYTRLGDRPIRLGIDDNPGRYAGAPHPVATRGDAPDHLPPGSPVLMTFRPDDAARTAADAAGWRLLQPLEVEVAP